ncbi:4-(cytidine 5'-diphospho)-2-C-methyl-D-erythritol kinase [Cryobacterium sp. TMT1-62]|uniref:4-diphosphocytidyl-2-C-methyl-D-erythritol kinase n=1 Tax=Cryobacterium sandaracinum TaxID=1259247 RepID=A0ABY2J9U9_9MICO|nr:MULTISPECIES: 4-(cytidine 5'-diphospho)-2-C-methyl-D-erythritol kinase [Cryobacterium]TFB54458.1 4-(cytidine 5'-diphospho)-2-C-methyl-D-erythritol kinase [Cryobacterium sp. Sr3]TFB64497.1 4-(cytidine 5'-diphospho)-2-C-methyl-D-erythritol kinase [Cryobacterium sp. Hz7]TFC49590.1 4-(cytidine 5'-diphospho)-2-C-methyl-D-erythritol kinase [Cryobacterium sp. TMT2-17-1]TFD00834.1 4-(cytidine 5'-diphospho)-2-C-methyl-D-erythritol kinase [Cryobacterium sandaracinum]TFD29496.1 4-(cytidine 5'-diphosph
MTNPAPSPVVHARAPGKINVCLKVGAVLEDGYHEVATAYQAVSLFEDVRAWPADDFSVVFTGTIDASGLAVDGSNLAIKAARALARKAGYRGGVRLSIEKNVPIAGGMGGGSADAAATLLACDTLWGTDATRDDLIEIAATLGADVPFAFTGGTAIGTGRGDQLSPALAKGQFHWVLALADFGLSTPGVYNELDRHRERHAQDIFPAQIQPSVDTNVLQALRAGDPRMLAEALHNDLQAPALHLAPGLGKVLELGEANGALAGLLSGSGPTVAFLVADADSALELQVALSASRLRVVRATGPVHGARIIHD